MKAIFSSRRNQYLTRVGILLITVALIAGMVGCAQPAQCNLTISTAEGGEITTPGEGTFSYDEGTVVPLVAFPHTGYRFVNWTGDVADIADVEDASTTITMKDDCSITATFAVNQYSLIVRSTEGGSVTTPGENAYTYDKGEVVNLVAAADEGYQFINWTGDVSTVADVNAASTAITINGHCTITASFAKEIRDWHDLDAIRDNLSGSYILMNDLDSTTAGYAELASLAAHGGKGWDPIGSIVVNPVYEYIAEPVDAFMGSLDGQGYEIRDLSISRPDEDGVGLFGSVDEGVIENLGVVTAEVIGHYVVGSLVAWNDGTVSDSYSTGGVTTGGAKVGSLVAWNKGAVNKCYSSGSVSGGWEVGGLIGWSDGTVSDSYSGCSVSGDWEVSGLVGFNALGATVSNSYYNLDEVLINDMNVITIGALVNTDFDQWLANDKSLDISGRLSQEDGYYLINDVSDFKQLLAFGQDSSLRFRLQNDLDLATEPNIYIPYLAGKFDGNGHRIVNLSFGADFVSHVGLFGLVANGGRVSEVGVENVNIIGAGHVGGLVGLNEGTITNTYAMGSLTGVNCVGGLVGLNDGSVSNSYSTCSVSGENRVGGLVGGTNRIVHSSFWDTETSQRTTSDGGTGKTTAEMKDIATFSGAGWNIIAVANPDIRNLAYMWNIVDDETYPFLSWQPVS